MKLDIASHHLEHLLWLQRELRQQDGFAKEHPVFMVIEHRPTGLWCRNKFLTRFVAEKFIAADDNRHRLQVVVEEGADNPEIRFLRELILGMDLTAYRLPEPAAPAKVAPISTRQLQQATGLDLVAYEIPQPVCEISNSKRDPAAAIQETLL